MDSSVELLIKLGLSKDHSIALCRSLYYDGARNTKKIGDTENNRATYETVPFDSLLTGEFASH